MELDSNPNSSNQHSTNFNSTQEKNYSGATTGSTSANSQERDIEIEAACYLLTKQEKSLCIQLDLKPTQYLTQKTLLLQVSGKHLLRFFLFCNYGIFC